MGLCDFSLVLCGLVLAVGLGGVVVLNCGNDSRDELEEEQQVLVNARFFPILSLPDKVREEKSCDRAQSTRVNSERMELESNTAEPKSNFEDRPKVQARDPPTTHSPTTYRSMIFFITAACRQGWM